MSKKLNLADTVKNISERLNEHIGSNGGRAHLMGDIDRPGFIYPEQVKQILEALGQRKQLTDGTDIFKLSPGRYWGSNLTNSSFPEGTAGISIIDVSELDKNTKQYQEIQSVWGSVHVYTTHTNASGTNVSAPNNWSSVERYTTLWEGNISKAGSTLTLTDDFWKYGAIRITTNNQNQEQRAAIYHVSGGWLSINMSNLYNSEKIQTSYKMVTKWDDKTMDINANLQYINNGSSIVTSDINLMSITKIEGVM